MNDANLKGNYPDPDYFVVLELLMTYARYCVPADYPKPSRDGRLDAGRDVVVQAAPGFTEILSFGNS